MKETLSKGSFRTKVSNWIPLHNTVTEDGQETKFAVYDNVKLGGASSRFVLKPEEMYLF